MRIFSKTLIASTALMTILLTDAPHAETSSLVIIAVSDTGGNFAPGQVLQTGERVDILAGNKVTFISESGNVITLNGPYSGPVASQSMDGDNKGTLSTIVEFISKQKKQSTVLGASRKVDPTDVFSQPDPWLMSIDSSGHRCVRQKGAQMWRKRSKTKASIALRNQYAKQTGLIWQAGKNRMPLPNPFIKDGSLIVMKIDQDPRRINLHVTPAGLDISRPGAVLNWMIDNKCSRQAEILIRQLHKSKR